MTDSTRIAIVGIGGVFPGAANVGELWELIAAGSAMSREVPEGRWILSKDDAYDPEAGKPDHVYSKHGCFLDATQIDATDLDLAIPNDLLSQLDPLFHVALRAGHQAIADAKMASVDRDRVGVLIGNIVLPTETSSLLAQEYLGRTFEEKLTGQASGYTQTPTHALNRYPAGLPAAIVAQGLGLGGIAYTLDAACASSLYALKLAADELIEGRADAMITGGLSRPDALYTQMGFSQLRALSPTGICAPFDTQSNGLLVGEGSGMLILKRLDDALAAGDQIYATLEGIGLSNDIGGSLLVPDSEGQLRAMREAYQKTGWKPSEVDLVECHGTGTPVGDRVEVHALETLWAEEAWQAGQCVIGSVKSNIGHLLTAAGSAALIKVLLAMKEGILPPTATTQQSIEKLGSDASPFRVLSKQESWTSRTKGQPRRAAVSAFGFGGINAHVLLQAWNGFTEETLTAHPTSVKTTSVTKPAVAIVGMDATFGPWQDLAAFRQRVLGGDTQTLPTQQRNWRGAENSDWIKQRSDSDPFFSGFGIHDFAVPLGRFRIPPKELEEMLPQQLLMLSVAERALADAGLNDLSDRRAGVFIGIGLDLETTHFSFRWSLLEKAKQWNKQYGLGLSPQALQTWVKELREAAGPALSANRTMGALGGIVASRIAREFRVGGPSFTLSSEQTSSLHALEAAYRAIEKGEIDTAIVGGVDFGGDLRAYLSTEAKVVLTGEGAAAVILKPLEEAEREGDQIYGIIKGIGSATSAQGSLERAMQQVLKDAVIDPTTIGYLEIDGGGDAVENAHELKAINTCYSDLKFPSPLGCVKGDIGHTGAAAGLASVLKACLCLHHEMIPPIRSLSAAPKHDSFYLTQEPQYWVRDRSNGSRRVAINSMGIGGNATHVLLEQYENPQSDVDESRLILPLGTENESLFALQKETLADLSASLGTLEALAQSSEKTLSINPLAHQWWQQENNPCSNNAYGIGLIVRSVTELLEQIEWISNHLDKVTRSKDSASLTQMDLPLPFADRIFFSAKPLAQQGKLAFVYPGSGNHFPGMGQGISALWPKIFHGQDQENQRLASQILPKTIWNATSQQALDNDAKATIFGQVVLGTVVTDLLKGFGLQPEAVIGYSLGESAALFSMKAWKDRDDMLRRMNASTLFTEDMAGECKTVRKTWGLTPDESVDWAICVVDRPAEAVRDALTKWPRAYLLIINTPNECVVGGDRQAVEGLISSLDCNAYPLHGITTVHCEVAQAVAEPYRDLHLFPTTAPEGVTFYSGAWGKSYSLSRDNCADSILAQALDGIDYPKTIEAAYADGARLFVEIGPGASCSRIIGNILGDRPHIARSACVANQSPYATILRLMGQLIAEGVQVDLSALYSDEAIESEKTELAILHRQVGGSAFRIPPLPKKTETSMDAAQKETSKPQPSQAEITLTSASTSSLSRAFEVTLAQFKKSETAKLEAHETFLQFSENLTQSYSDILQWQMSLLGSLPAGSNIESASLDLPLKPTENIGQSSASYPPSANKSWIPNALPREQRVPFSSAPATLDRRQCMEFAIGKIGNVLGAEYAPIDAYPTRVRLPDEPLMLVDRILTLEGEPRSMSHGRVVTEHDIHTDAWYLDAGVIPTCIAVEAGQADLFLAGYLGIDFESKGLAVYRLLDAVVTFHRQLPKPGEVIHYDIHIERFFRQGDTYLFRFNFEATVDGAPLLSMKEGCAGFFTQAELDGGKGIVHTQLDLQPQPKALPVDWEVFVPMTEASYHASKVEALRMGDLLGCFGELFAGLPIHDPVGLPSGKMSLVDRVLHLDPSGGKYGLGAIRAEADIHPDDWFLICHFVDDRVMPGTLMYECCLHTLRIFLLRMGWVGESGEVIYEPIPGVSSQLKCRGQVLETTQKVTYKIAIKELGYQDGGQGAPYAIADALMYADGKPIVEIPNMSVRLRGLTHEQLTQTWAKQKQFREQKSLQPAPDEAYNKTQINAYAIGNPSAGFGERYKVFDHERILARLPGPPYLYMDRVVQVDSEPWVMKPGGTVIAQYDVPVNAWYFSADRCARMPYAILLEIALQPCGWFAAYMGSVLSSETDLSFRNLGGKGVQHLAVTPDSGTLTMEIKSTSISQSGGMIIQNYDLEVRSQAGIVFKGDTYFGFFSKESLADQVGIRETAPYSPTAEELERSAAFEFPHVPPFPDARLRMVDRVDLFITDGGPSRLGLIRGIKTVNPKDWFFKAHFYQDPVCPGSLGLESFLQLLKIAAVDRWGVEQITGFQAMSLDSEHSWVYRGQIIPEDSEVTIDAVITEIDDDGYSLKAEGFLSVDGRIIYQMKNFSISAIVA